MSRPLRIEYPGAWYHVMNRGRRSESIFLDNDDYGLFIDLLIELSESFNVNVAAYCLMTTHYHILLQTPDGTGAGQEAKTRAGCADIVDKRKKSDFFSKERCFFS